jgi:cob(I)alamin adenosyltransferase
LIGTIEIDMKIYTKTGDDGSTGLIGGRRVSKGDARLECYGTIDELNACVGWATAGAEASLVEKLRPVQNELFVIGALLATPDDGKPPANVVMPALQESSVARLEAQIDAAEAVLQPLHSFILPGGVEASSRLHVARTVCRRAERLLVGFAGSHAVDPLLVRYLNRLSDWLFVHARLANQLAGVADVPWVK